MAKAADVSSLFDIVKDRMSAKATTEDVLKVMENVAKLAHSGPIKAKKKLKKNLDSTN